MSKIQFVIDGEFEKVLIDLFEFYGINGESNSLKTKELLIEIHRKDIVYKESPEQGEQTSESKIDMTEIPCKKLLKARLVTKKKVGKEIFYCVNRPPRMTRLETLDICKVCLAVFKHGFTNHTKALAEEIEKAQNTPEPQSQPQVTPQYNEWKKDPAKKMDKYGMIWCEPDGGIWVYPSKCELCKEKSNLKFSECQKQRIQRLQTQAQRSQPSKT